MANKIGVVLALDGEKEFANGMKQAQETAKQLDVALKSLSTQYAGSANSMEALSKKQDVLKQKEEAYGRVITNAESARKKAVEAYNEQKKSVEELSKALEEAKKNGDQGGIEKYTKQLSSAQSTLSRLDTNISKWDTTIAKAKSSLAENGVELVKNGHYMDEASSSADKCATSIDKMGNEMKQAGNDAKSSSTGLSNVFQTIKAGAFLKLGSMMSEGLSKLGDYAKQAAKYVVEVGSTFEASMSKVQALSGASGQDFEALSEKAQELGRTTQFSASEAADAMSNMALAGWDTRQTLDGIDGVLQLAAAGGMDLATAADTVAGNLAAFNLQASDSQHLADVMATAQAKSKTTADQLAEAYTTVATNWTQAGQSCETTTAAIEALASVNDTGSAAGTKLSAVMAQITQKMEDGKIKIGDTTVAVTDSTGKFRDMIDIVRDVENATAGMTDAQRQSALMATFNRQSMSGMNEMLSVGSAKLAEYRSQLVNSDGAAADMAATMQDNLQGAMKAFNSATEGLGIALYNQIKGPMTSAVEGATSLINGITDAITPQKTVVDSFLDEIAQSDEKIQSLLDKSRQTMDNADSKIRDVQAYRDVIMQLQSVIQSGGKLDPFQIYQMQTAVDALSNDIPQLKAHFDETTGAIGLSADAMQRLFDITEKSIMQEATREARADAYKGLAEAKIEQAKAQAAYNDLLEKEKEIEAAGALNVDNPYFDQIPDLKRDLDAAGAALDKANKSVEESQKQLDITNKATEKLTKSSRENKDAITANMSEQDKAAMAASAGADAQREEQLAMRENAEAAGDAASAQGELADATGDASDAAEDSGNAWDAAVSSMHTVEDACSQVVDAYNSAKESLSQGFSPNLFGEFDGGEDQTVEKMTENLQNQIQAMEQYAQNYQTVSEHVGKEITPEFMQYLRDMGVEGANTLDHIAKTFQEENGSEKVQQLVDEYMQTLDQKDQITSTLAGDTVATQNGLGELGSSIEEWGGLTDSMNAVFGDLSNVTTEDVQNLISTLQSQGVQIPQSLQEAISSGSMSPSEAMTQMLASTIATAQSEGVKIPDGLRDGIESGQISVGDAIVQLQNAITGHEQGLKQAGEKSGKAANEGIKSGVNSTKGEAATAISDATKEAANSASTGDAGTQAGQTIMTNIAASVTENESVLASAVDSALQNAASGKGNVDFSSIGRNITTQIAQGVESNASSISSALTRAIQSGTSGKGQSSSGIGAQIVAGIANEISSSSVIGTAMSAAMKAASQSGTNNAKSFRTIGQTAARTAADGISGSSGSVSRAASSMMSQAHAAASGHSFFGIGYNAGAGVAAGLWAAVPSVRAAAAAIILSVAAAMAAKAIIRSPSHLMRDKIGKQLGAGVAVGIRASKTVTNDAAKDLVNSAFASAAWAANAKLKGATMGRLSEYYWTAASEVINRKFAVSRYKEDGSGKNKKTVKKGTAEYNSDIMEAAESFFSNMQVLYDLDNDKQLQYWRNVRNQLRGGTQAWYDCTAKIKELNKTIAKEQEEIRNNTGTYTVANSVYETWSKYFTASEYATQKYWDIIRKKYAVGTDDRIKADEAYYKAHKEYTDKLAEINKTYDQQVEESNKKYTDELAQRKSDILGSFGLFDEYKSESASGSQLLFNIQSQAAGYKEWSETLDALADRGILSNDLLKELTEQGPDQSAAIHALMSLTDNDLRAYQAAYDARSAAAQKQAEKDTSSLKTTVEKEIKDINAKRKADLAVVNQGIDKSLEKLANGIRGIYSENVDRIISAIKYPKEMAQQTQQAAAAHTALRQKDDKIVAKANKPAPAKPAAKKTTTTKKPSGSKKQTRYRLTGAYNLRNKAGTSKAGTSGTRALATIPKGATVTGTGQKKNNWIEVVYGKKRGWVWHAGLKAYATGIRRAADELAWTSEGGRQEMILRKSDRAVLTSLRAGDAVVSAKNTGNLWEWSKISPQALSRIMPTAELNAQLLAGYTRMQQSTDRSEGVMRQILSLMAQYLPELSAKDHRTEIVLDSGALVGGLSDGISTEMAMRTRRRRG